MNKRTTDVCIVGAGLAGLYTALHIKDTIHITIISKDDISDVSSRLAQGGIAAVMQENGEDLLSHIEDSIIAGAYLNNKLALETLVYEAKDNINDLIDLGVRFDQDDEGNILLTREGGHSKQRILRSGGDATGKELMTKLYQQVLSKPNIAVIHNSMAVDILQKEGKAYGVSIIDDNGKVTNILSAKTILATGGVGAIFESSTNALEATGDGIAMAKRAKVKVNNMEFIQFHPTGLYDKKSRSRQRFLISEAVRGEGGILRNVDGERFMSKYHKSLELAPRDIVSQSIYKEMYDTWSDYVYLDVTHMGSEFMKNRFPTIYKMTQSFGLNLDQDYIPVAPVEHYSIGGISINIDGETSMPNLFANGECADSGVHGANRLASNSLLECIVFGRKIANKINQSELSHVLVEESFSPPFRKYSYHVINQEIRALMSKYVGIVRTTDGLILARGVVKRHVENLRDHPVRSRHYVKAYNIATTALEIIDSALARKDSIGTHYRID